MAATPVAPRTSRVLIGTAVAGLAAIGLVRAPVVALGVGSVGAALGMLAAFWVSQRNRGVDPSGATVLRYAAAGLISVPALAGLATLLGSATTPVVLAGAGVLVGRRCWARRGRARRAGDLDALDLAAQDLETRDLATLDLGALDIAARDLAALSDVELGRAWRASHAALARARDPVALGRIVALRGRQLDEMERRDPAGFRRWIDGGGWASADSMPFLGGS